MISKYKGSVETQISTRNGKPENRVVFIIEASLPEDCKLDDQRILIDEVNRRFKLLTDPLVNENELTQTGKP